jgi:hypothetical protein
MRVNHKTIIRLAIQAGADYKKFNKRYENFSLARYTELLNEHMHKRGKVALRQALINVLGEKGLR